MPFISSVRGSFGAQARLTKNFNAQMRAAVTGGTITTSGGYRIHTFQYAQTGTALVLPAGGLQVEYLIVGAGGGGSNIIGGGGGGGGMLSGTIAIPSTSTTITVGQGLRGGYGYNSPGLDFGLKGGDSSIGNLAIGYGGGGASGWQSFTSDSARDAVINGGSGAGGSANQNYGSRPFGQQAGGTGVVGQGYPGGEGGDDSAGKERGGGGGGAGQAGFSGMTTIGNGGSGLASSISGSSVFYAGGGGSGRRCSSNTSGNSSGGAGGGGNGSVNCSGGSSGTNGLGGGGGGGAYPYSDSSQIVGGYGGHGVVIIRYPTS